MLASRLGPTTAGPQKACPDTDTWFLLARWSTTSLPVSVVLFRVAVLCSPTRFHPYSMFPFASQVCVLTNQSDCPPLQPSLVGKAGSTIWAICTRAQGPFGHKGALRICMIIINIIFFFLLSCTFMWSWSPSGGHGGPKQPLSSLMPRLVWSFSERLSWTTKFRPNRTVCRRLNSSQIKVSKINAGAAYS